MKENEALECLKSSKRKNDILGILPVSDIGNTIIKALEEVQQYRQIGTVEECRAAVEKQTAKKVEIWNDGSEHCPCCDKNNSYLGFKVCIECGQLLDWNEET